VEITYTISDGKGGTATSTVTVDVTPVNDPPVANPSTATTPEETPVTLNVLGNDSDPDGDPLTVTNATVSAKGSVTINPDGTLAFNPAPNQWAGGDHLHHLRWQGRHCHQHRHG
jgi:hypothetical protein